MTEEDDAKRRALEARFNLLFGGLGRELETADMLRQLEEIMDQFAAELGASVYQHLGGALSELLARYKDISNNGGDVSRLVADAREFLRQVTVLRMRLELQRDQLIAQNDSFAATQEFLVARGLKSVAELDESGRQDLMAYLEGILKQAINPE